MQEIELKAVVDDLELRKANVEAAGATLTYAGRLEDTRYDMTDKRLSRDDVVLRVRSYRQPESTKAMLDWKGPGKKINGYKVREELSTPVTDPDTLVTILENLGYVVERCVDRHITQYDLNGTMIRFEEYPKLDVLVEVEGEPEAIEQAIQVIGLPRDAFTTKRLADFVSDYQRRTGQKAVVSDRPSSRD